MSDRRRKDAAAPKGDRVTPLGDYARWMASTILEVVSGRITPREGNRRAREVGRVLKRLEAGR